jgi:uncharacterized protein
MQAPFWQTKTLEQLTEPEWESLCDGCGKCCLHKLEDEDTGRIHLTVVACRLLDIERCRCGDYTKRFSRVPGCVRVRPDNVRSLALPPSCAYRRLAEGRDLASWHPLVSGDPESTLRAGASVRGFAIPEDQVAEDELEDFIFQELAPAGTTR